MNKLFTIPLDIIGSDDAEIEKNLNIILPLYHNEGYKINTVTNGVPLINKNIRKLILDYVNICIINIDAINEETWNVLHKDDLFYKVIFGCVNIIKEVKAKKDNKLALLFNYEVNGLNQYELLKACKVAKMIGFKNFNYSLSSKLFNYEIDINALNKQVKECIKLEDNNFKIICRCFQNE